MTNEREDELEALTRYNSDMTPPFLDPREYELEVKSFLESAGSTLSSFSTKHRDLVDSGTQAYEIDVTARFRAIGGAEFLVLIECKAWQRRVPRSVVEILHDRILSIGGTKGMVFSLSGYQRGAINYATSRKIALIEFVAGVAHVITRDASEKDASKTRVPCVVGYWPSNRDGGIRVALTSEANCNQLLGFLNG